VVNAENAERQWRLGLIDWWGQQAPILSGERGERRKAMETLLLGFYPLLLPSGVVNAENAERQWRLPVAIPMHRARPCRVVNAENAERQWRPNLIRQAIGVVVAQW